MSACTRRLLLAEAKELHNCQSLGRQKARRGTCCQGKSKQRSRRILQKCMKSVIVPVSILVNYTENSCGEGTGIWRDAVKLSPILHSYFCSCTTLFSLKWQTLKGDGETAEMVVHFPLGHSSVGRVLAAALWLCRVRKQAQRAQLFAVSILKATTQAKSPLNDSPSLIT